jgi:hypothetical protein
MAQGPSGRIVIEMDPDVKQELHSALERSGMTLKEWFIQRAEEYLHADADADNASVASRDPFPQRKLG